MSNTEPAERHALPRPTQRGREALSVRRRAAVLDPRAGIARLLARELSLTHASVRIAAADRAGRERLLRYYARPPFALDRLRELDGEHPTPGGSSPLHLTPLALLDRLAALVPPPRIQRHRYFAVLARTAAHWKLPRLPRTAGVGRVSPATSLAREAAVQRIAGIQYPVAVGSVRLGKERSPRLAVVGCHGWIDGRGEAAVDDVVPCINDKQVASSAALPFPCSARRDAPGVRYRLGARRFTVGTPHPPIARKPAWMLDFALEIYRQPENRPDGKFPPGTQRNILTVRFTVRLKGIPAIDLDRSGQTFAR